MNKLIIALATLSAFALGGCLENIEEPSKKKEVYANGCYASIASTVHDGHLYVVAMGMRCVSIIHSPSCGCHKKGTDK